jgi:peptidyl-prolyl cis-trans isomerase D
MLQRIRDSLEKQKWLTYVVLGTLAVIFAAWGAYGIVNLSVNGTSYAAEAGGQKIPVEEARKAWMRQQSQFQQTYGAEIPAALKEQLQDRLLESMVRDALLTDRSHDLGYRASTQAVNDYMKSFPAFQVGGLYNEQVAQEALANAGVSVDTFKAQVREDLQRQQLLNGIGLSDFVTPHELERTRALQNEQREVRFVSLPPEKYEADATVDDATVQAYYKAHEKTYMTPESVHLQFGELRVDAVAAQVTVSDVDLHAAYEKQKAQFVQPEKRRASHILITVDKDDAAALKQAQDVLAQAKAGKDFGQLAKQYSKDPGSAEKGGELDWFDKTSAIAAPFRDALFSMSPGEIRGPVKTQFGYHIIKLLEIQPGTTKTFEEARPELEAELKRNRATDRFGEIQEQLQSKIEQPGASLEALAKEFNLQTGDVPQFVRGAGGGTLGAAQPVQDVVFGDSALGVGKVGGPVVLGDDRLVILNVLDHSNPHVKPLAEVRDSIVAALRKEHGTAGALKAAQAARDKLEAGASFDEVGKDLGVTVEPAKFVGRTDPSVPTPIRTRVFDSTKPAGKPVYLTVPLQNGGAAVVAITAVRQPPADQVDKKAEQQAEVDAQQKDGNADIAAYVAEVRRTSDVKKNPKALD